MTEPKPNFSIGELILVPALITLGITLLRLIGELGRWSPAFFNRDAGGAGAIVGIVWLVPILGVYFALRLSKAGRSPNSRARAVGFALAGLTLFLVLYSPLPTLSASWVVRIVLINFAAALSALVAYRGWPELGRTELAYGLAARIPVALVMFVAMAANWGTHYELGPPGFPEMSLVPKWIALGLLPQLVFWIAFTVLVGSLFGSLSLLFKRTSR